MIERDASGRLHAYVEEQREDGFVHRGDDLLRDHIFRNIDNATVECDRKILALFKLLDPPKIEYVIAGAARAEKREPPAGDTFF